jgi:hypothetical protein
VAAVALLGADNREQLGFKNTIGQLFGKGPAQAGSFEPGERLAHRRGDYADPTSDLTDG